MNYHNYQKKCKKLITLSGDMSEMLSEMAYSVDPEQTAPEEQSDLGLYCLLRLFIPNI